MLGLLVVKIVIFIQPFITAHASKAEIHFFDLLHVLDRCMTSHLSGKEQIFLPKIWRLSKGQIAHFVLFVLTMCWRNFFWQLDEGALGSITCAFGGSTTRSDVLALSTATQVMHHHSQVIYFLILKQNHIGHLLNNISHINHFVLNQDRKTHV